MFVNGRLRRLPQAIGARQCNENRDSSNSQVVAAHTLNVHAPGCMPGIRQFLYSPVSSRGMRLRSGNRCSAFPRQVARRSLCGNWSHNRRSKPRVVGACNCDEVTRHLDLVVIGNLCAPTVHFLDFHHPLLRCQPLLPQHRRLMARHASGTHRIHAVTRRP